MKLWTRQVCAFCMVIAVLVTAAMVTFQARAVTMTASDGCIAFIKSFEGFCDHVYWDGGVSYIGYGTSCNASAYPGKITEKQGEALLRKALSSMEQEVNAYLNENGIQVTQYQYDALLDLTYNLGGMWIDDAYYLCSILKAGISKYPDIAVVNGFGVWCHQGGAVADYLVDRRIKDAKLFLYNDYAGTDSHTYRYLEFDPAGGNVDHSIQYFEYNKAYGEIEKPTRAGYAFAGWYTANGTKITSTTNAASDLAVTAAWCQGEIPVKSGFSDIATSAWYYQYVTELNNADIISGYPDGGFHPGEYVSCGAALKLIFLAVGYSQQSATENHWASGYLSKAVMQGIVSTGEIADLNTPISREMIARIAAKSLGLPPIETAEATFNDTNDGYVLALYHSKIITGSSEGGALSFNPTAYITRAELSAIIWRMSKSPLLQQ